MTCRDVTEFLDRYLSAELPPRHRIDLKIHLLHCADCRNYLHAYRQTLQSVQRLRNTPDTEPAELSEELVRRILASRDRTRR